MSNNRSDSAAVLKVGACQHNAVARHKLPDVKVVNGATEHNVGRGVNDKFVVTNVKTAVFTDDLVDTVTIFGDVFDVLTAPIGPQGIQGEQGPVGPQGPAGADAEPITLTIGTVTTGAPGTDAAASITGTSPNFVLNLTIPQGEPGTSAG